MPELNKQPESFCKEEVLAYHYWLLTTDFNVAGHAPEDCLEEWILTDYK